MVPGQGSGELVAEINSHDYRLAREIFHRYDFISAIKNILLSKVFGAGIHLYSNKDLIKMEESRRAPFLKRWITLGRKIFEEWYTLGIVPYRWKWDPELEMDFPVIISETMGLTYRLKVITTAQSKRFEYYATGSTKPDKTVLFLDEFNCNPEFNGSLTSPIIQLRSLYFTLVISHTLKSKASALKATPRLIAETAEPLIQASLQNSMTASQLYRTNVGLREAERDGDSNILHQMQRQALDNRKMMNAAWEESNRAGQTMTYRDLFQNVAAGGPSVITINDRQKITAAPPVAEPDNFVEFERALKQYMAAVLQVPYGIVMGETTSRTAATATDLTLPSFIREIIALKMMLGTVLTQLFQEWIRRKRDRDLTEFRKTVKTKRGKRKLEKDYMGMNWGDFDESLVKMTLIHNDIQDQAGLAALYVADVLSYSQFLHEQLSNLPFDQMQREALEERALKVPDPFSPEEKGYLAREYIGNLLLGTSTGLDRRDQDREDAITKEKREGMTSLSLGTHAKRKKTGSSSSIVTEPTTTNTS